MLRKVVNTFIASSCGSPEVNTESWFRCICVYSLTQFKILMSYRANMLIMNYMFYVKYIYISAIDGISLNYLYEKVKEYSDYLPSNQQGH